MIFPAGCQTPSTMARLQELTNRGTSAEELTCRIDADDLAPLRERHLLKGRVLPQTKATADGSQDSTKCAGFVFC